MDRFYGGEEGAEKMVAITNTGQVPITSWVGGAVPAPFNGSQGCNVQGGLLPGKTCHFYYTFAPSVIGSYAATSGFSTNAGSFKVKLHGSVIAPFHALAACGPELSALRAAHPVIFS
jgi:hypothetical protein